MIKLHKLPCYPKGESPQSHINDPIGRFLSGKGELATLCITPINYLAYVDFPKGATPRANHYHEHKHEFLYLIEGKIKLLYRLGGQPDKMVEEIVVEAGSLIEIPPGIAHVCITLEKGHAVEFSPTPYEILKSDKVRDMLI